MRRVAPVEAEMRTAGVSGLKGCDKVLNARKIAGWLGGINKLSDAMTRDATNLTNWTLVCACDSELRSHSSNHGEIRLGCVIGRVAMELRQKKKVELDNHDCPGSQPAAKPPQVASCPCFQNNSKSIRGFTEHLNLQHVTFAGYHLVKNWIHKKSEKERRNQACHNHNSEGPLSVGTNAVRKRSGKQAQAGH